MPQQQVLIGPAPMEGVERMNAVMMNPQQRAGLPQRNPYVMERFDTNIFLSLLSIFLDFIFLFF